jgi:threonine dehydratase
VTKVTNAQLMGEAVDPLPVSLAAIEDARPHIAGSALRTPLVRLNCFEAPSEIYLKLENLQPIGSFKIRGAANAMAHIPGDQLQRGVLTASAGNMAQGEPGERANWAFRAPSSLPKPRPPSSFRPLSAWAGV